MSSESDRAAWVAESELRGPSFAGVSEVHPVALVLIGAVPLAAAMSTLSQAIGWRAWVVDPRGRFGGAERFPSAEEVLVEWPEAAFTRLGGLSDASAVVALAHDPILDDPALVVALSSPAFFVGAMGSRRTQAARRERLLAAGVDEEDVRRLSGPLGLDLGARTVMETALSAIGEIVAARYDRPGGRLRDALGSIRTVSA